jgi:hypothetical protein
MNYYYPILVEQDAYGSEFLNKWNGNMTLDNNNNYLMSALVGAGTKDLNNKFTGVIMGDIGQKLDDDQISYEESGLFGYNKGNQAFGLELMVLLL